MDLVNEYMEGYQLLVSLMIGTLGSFFVIGVIAYFIKKSKKNKEKAEYELVLQKNLTEFSDVIADKVVRKLEQKKRD